MNDRALRNVIVGLGGKANGVPREDGFNITVASEVMAILCLATDIADLKERLGNILVAYDLNGWTYEEKGMRYGGRLIAENPGSTFKFDFEGTDLGLFYNADEDCGKLSFLVDGKQQLIVDTYLWHENCKEKIIFTSLTPGKHTVEVTLLQDKNGKSSGTKAEIGAFLVG